MPDMEFSPIKRMTAIKKLVENSLTEIQYKTRLKLLQRLAHHLQQSETDAGLHGRLLTDFPAFCAYYLSDDEGNPLLLSNWQLEWGEKIEKNRRSVTWCCRQTGKSTLHAAYVLWDGLAVDHRQWNLIAPTRGQDHVYRRVRRHIESNPILYNQYVGTAGTVNWEHIDLTNGSVFRNLTIGLATKGELIRGYSGSVLVDEVQRLEREMFHVIIAPFLLSSYAEKKLLLLGTPSLAWNPELATMTEDWATKADSMVYTLGWERGVEEGCVKLEEIIDWMGKMTSDEIDTEFNAKFPTETGRYYPHTMLVAAAEGARGAYNLLTFDQLTPDPSKTRVMTVDWAQLHDRTEILIGELFEDKMRAVFWKRLDPRDGIIDWSVQYQLVKDIFHRAGCWLVMPDFSAGQDKMLKDIVAPPNGIMEGQIWHDAKARPGYRASSEANHELWTNHRRILSGNRFIVPRGNGDGSPADTLSRKFYAEFVSQHNALESDTIGPHKQYVQLKEPKNGFKDLAIVSAMLSLYVKNQSSPPSFSIGSFGRKRR